MSLTNLLSPVLSWLGSLDYTGFCVLLLVIVLFIFVPGIVRAFKS